MTVSKWEKSKPLIIIEMIVYGGIAAWFLYAFLPVGLK